MNLLRQWWPLLVVALAFLADRLSKWWVAGYLAAQGPVRIGAWLTLRETYNQGLAFGLLQGTGSLMGWLTLLIAALLLFYLVQLPPEMWLMRLGLALIVGGALGNMVDRIVSGRVLDFFETPFRQGIFNVADICINVGALICLAGILLQKPAGAGSPPPEEVPPL
ncbi:MAG: signal peptidase II [Pseudomonadales bacterium]|nr:signal peptidase II [Ardenticatenaceae bacterium]MCP5191380.1 signal peptidase II [Pseudomonadales bacterium]